MPRTHSRDVQSKVVPLKRTLKGQLNKPDVEWVAQSSVGHYDGAMGRKEVAMTCRIPRAGRATGQLLSEALVRN